MAATREDVYEAIWWDDVCGWGLCEEQAEYRVFYPDDRFIDVCEDCAREAAIPEAVERWGRHESAAWG